MWCGVAVQCVVVWCVAFRVGTWWAPRVSSTVVFGLGWCWVTLCCVVWCRAVSCGVVVCLVAVRCGVLSCGLLRRVVRLLIG